MEREVKIKTPDKKTIYGTLTRGSSDKLIIFVHGFTGHRNEHLFYNGAKFFSKNGYSVCRISLYDFEKNARKLRDTGVLTHAKDIATAVHQFSKKHKRIYLIGHSLGGPSILLSDLKKVSGIILWDPTSGGYKGRVPWLDAKYQQSVNAYIVPDNVDFIIDKHVYDELAHLPPMPPIMNKLKIPYLIILAGKGVLKKEWKTVKNTIMITGATHCFHEEGTEELLFKKTLEFLKKN